MGTSEADLDYFVVRSAGAWTLAPLPAAEPVPVGVSSILDRMRAGAGSVPPSMQPRGALAGPTVSDDDTIAPAWMFVGLVAAGRLLVGNHRGEVAALDDQDVALVDRLTAPCLVADLAEGDRVGLRRRLSRLVAAGVATVDTAVTLHPDPQRPSAQLLADAAEVVGSERTELLANAGPEAERRSWFGRRRGRRR